MRSRFVCKQPCLASVLLVCLLPSLLIQYSEAFLSPVQVVREHIPSSSAASWTCMDNNGRRVHTQVLAGLSLEDMEKEVLASAQAKLDMKRVKNALFQKGQLDDEDDTNRTILEESSLVVSSSSSDSTTKGGPAPSKWGIAFSAGIFFATSSFLLLHSFTFSGLAFGIAVYIASRDPVTEVGLVEGDDISGPMTRIVGRATYQSLESAKPTLQAVTRAVVDGDAVVDKLEQQVLELQRENEELKLWRQRRTGVDDQMGGYTVGDLKAIAKKDGLTMGGTKAQLMMRLVEAGSLQLDEK